MKTFESCNRVWLTMPEDGKCPVPHGAFVRFLLEDERDGLEDYGEDNKLLGHKQTWTWNPSEGWYPTNSDGTDDHVTARKFLQRPKQIRRRFKLSTKRSILP